MIMGIDGIEPPTKILSESYSANELNARATDQTFIKQSGIE
jgi:hypothetical protein